MSGKPPPFFAGDRVIYNLGPNAQVEGEVISVCHYVSGSCYVTAKFDLLGDIKFNTLHQCISDAVPLSALRRITGEPVSITQVPIDQPDRTSFSIFEAVMLLLKKGASK